MQKSDKVIYTLFILILLSLALIGLNQNSMGETDITPSTYTSVSWDHKGDMYVVTNYKQISLFDADSRELLHSYSFSEPTYYYDRSPFHVEWNSADTHVVLNNFVNVYIFEIVEKKLQLVYHDIDRLNHHYYEFGFNGPDNILEMDQKVVSDNETWYIVNRTLRGAIVWEYELPYISSFNLYLNAKNDFFILTNYEGHLFKMELSSLSITQISTIGGYFFIGYSPDSNFALLERNNQEYLLNMQTFEITPMDGINKIKENSIDHHFQDVIWGDDNVIITITQDTYDPIVSTEVKKIDFWDINSQTIVKSFTIRKGDLNHNQVIFLSYQPDSGTLVLKDENTSKVYFAEINDFNITMNQLSFLMYFVLSLTIFLSILVGLLYVVDLKLEFSSPTIINLRRTEDANINLLGKLGIGLVVIYNILFPFFLSQLFIDNPDYYPNDLNLVITFMQISFAWLDVIGFSLIILFLYYRNRDFNGEDIVVLPWLFTMWVLGSLIWRVYSGYLLGLNYKEDYASFDTVETVVMINSFILFSIFIFYLFNGFHHISKESLNGKFSMIQVRGATLAILNIVSIILYKQIGYDIFKFFIYPLLLVYFLIRTAIDSKHAMQLKEKFDESIIFT